MSKLFEYIENGIENWKQLFGVDSALDTTNFNKNLSSTDTDVQIAMDTLNDLDIPNHLIVGTLRKNINTSFLVQNGTNIFELIWQTEDYKADAAGYNCSRSNLGSGDYKYFKSNTGTHKLGEFVYLHLEGASELVGAGTYLRSKIFIVRYDSNDTPLETIEIALNWWDYSHLAVLTTGITVAVNFSLFGYLPYQLTQGQYSRAYLWVDSGLSNYNLDCTGLHTYKIEKTE